MGATILFRRSVFRLNTKNHSDRRASVVDKTGQELTNRKRSRDESFADGEYGIQVQPHRPKQIRRAQARCRCLMPSDVQNACGRHACRSLRVATILEKPAGTGTSTLSVNAASSSQTNMRCILSSLRHGPQSSRCCSKRSVRSASSSPSTYAANRSLSQFLFDRQWAFQIPVIPFSTNCCRIISRARNSRFLTVPSGRPVTSTISS